MRTRFLKSLKLSRMLAARLFAVTLLLATAASALADVHYVDVNSTNATPPYTERATAAANIRDGVDGARQAVMPINPALP